MSDYSVSVIINTDGRAKSLAVTLDSLRHLEYDNFEVCVVHGPTPDGTEELLQGWCDSAKVGRCRNRNLSESRNIGLAIAAGQIAAFLDDDAIPEPEWLTQVVAPYIDPKVGCSGGFLLDHTGVDFQWKYGVADRFGSADPGWQRPATEFNFPFSASYPHFVGANSTFRREAIMQIGGFDEQFVYFLDETDVICRLIDAGWAVAQVEGARVHHKFRGSHLRSEDRVLTSWHAIIRSKMYFCLVNAQGHHEVCAAIEATQRFAEELRRGLEWHISEGRADPSLRERFEKDYNDAMRSGLEAGLLNDRIFYDKAKLSDHARRFKKFSAITPDGPRRCICLLTRDYPPGSIGGIGRYTQQLARGLAAKGHQAHVLTESDRDTVDFEDGVWVHRRRRKPQERSERATRLGVPQRIWDYSATMLEAARGIAEERPIDAVFAPIWDCEGVAFLFDGRWPLFTSLHTTLAFYLESHAHKQRDEAFMRDFARPMLDLERTMFAQSDAILANSKAIVQQIEDRYSIVFHEDRLAIVPHGQEDWTPLAAKAPRPLPDGGVRLVFVGRLEERKGIDVLLAALDKVLSSRPFLSADIVGNDRLPSGDGRTFREAWENENTAKSYARRVRFHGEVDDEVLRGFYRAADIFVAPSRFESFGLIFLEAMMCGKPMIGCRAGGMPEVIREGLTGLLAEPGDVESLANAIARLADDAALRARLGQAARADYEARFTPALMANGALAFLARFARGAHQRQPCKGERCDPSGPERSPPAASRRADQQHRRAQ